MGEKDGLIQAYCVFVSTTDIRVCLLVRYLSLLKLTLVQTRKATHQPLRYLYICMLASAAEFEVKFATPTPTFNFQNFRLDLLKIT